MIRKRKRRAIHRCTCSVCQGHPQSAVAKQHRAINRVLGTLNEKSRRRFVGLLVLQRSRGGVELLATITGLSRTTIRRGRTEIEHTDPSARVRQSGGGRKAVEKNNPQF